MPKHGRPSSRSKEMYLFNSPLAAPYGTLYSGNMNVRIVGGKLLPDQRPSATQYNGVDLSTPIGNDLDGPATNRNQTQYHSSNAQEKADLLSPGVNGSINPHRVLPAIGSHRADEHSVDICDVYNKLPRDSMVSIEPLILPDDERVAVMREVQRELQYLDQSVLNRVYADLQRSDHAMSGYLPFQDLMMTLNKNQIVLPSRLLRLIACMFVSRIEQGAVGYHNILSFISNAINGIMPGDASKEKYEEEDKRVNLNTTYGQSFERPLLLQDRYQALTQAANSARPPEPRQYSPPNQPAQSQSPQNTYYQSARETWAPNPAQLSPRSGDMQRTLRQLQSRLPDRLNLEALRHAFQRADRYHRGTLSESQIQEICLECLGVDREVVDMLVSGLPPRGGGQYNWQSFIDLLERVLPISTTLNIPASKRPLEYARPLRQPAPTWPAPEASPSPPPMGGFRAPAFDAPGPERGPYEPPVGLPPAAPQDALGGMGLHREDTFRSADLNTYAAASTYMDQSGVIPPVETTYPNPLDVTGEPWSTRFMKLANIIYRNDQKHTGVIEEDKLRWLTRECNSVCHLNLSEEAVQDAVSRNRKNGSVNIHGYLTSLAMTH